MKLIDSRRLTGPNLLWNKCGAIIDVEFDSADSQVVDLWDKYVHEMFARLGWTDERTVIRQYPDGASLAISAPIDVLYTATEINDWCWDSAVTYLVDAKEPDFDRASDDFVEEIEKEANPNVLAVQQFAADNDLPFLRDDDQVSLGLGKYSRTWEVADMPDISSLQVASYKSIPVGLITGTNGKTTSTRLASHIAQTAGLNVGISSTDWIAVNNDIIDKGDYSGPGGARTVLRDQRVDLAILETARGGLLRRGLGVNHANAALITNIAEDHMGEFGVQTLDELADVKWIVSSVLGDQDKLILNADDPLLIERAERSDLDIAWFSPDSKNPLVQENIAHKKWASTVENNQIVLYADGVREVLLDVSKVPITLDGAAVHNVQNTLGVVLLTSALRISQEHIKTGLKSFSNADNPGRCNLFEINGAKVIVDFAHNPHGMRAFVSVARNLTAKRKLLINGQAGDRSDEDIKELACESVDGVDFDKIIIKLMKKYNRGRETGEAANILKQQYIDSGVEEQKITLIEQEIDAVTQAIEWSQPGDLLIMLVHEDRNQVLELLTKLENG